MAFTALDDVLAKMPGQVLAFAKGTAQSTAGLLISNWLNGPFPAAGTAPTLLNGHALTDASGGVPTFVNPASGSSYVGRVTGRVGNSASSGVPVNCTVWVYDRLWHNLVAVGSGAQAITPASITRFTDGAGVEAWWETYATMGAGTPTVTLSYTDQDGNAETTGSSGALVTTMAASRTGQFQLASGDTGVRAITGWNASATFTSGSIGAVLRRKIATLHYQLQPDGPSAFDLLKVGMPAVPDDACLELVMLLGTSAASVFNGSIWLVQG